MQQSDDSNPFAPIRAADYTDAQINGLWVELGATKVATILEPRSIVSKYILGSKGSGKTHLLRYHSYQVARLRTPASRGLSIVEATGCLAIFLRTTSMDYGRFEMRGVSTDALQQLFSVHLELKLADLVAEALQDISRSGAPDSFDTKSFVSQIGRTISDESFSTVSDLPQLRAWTSRWLRAIDDATNAAAFTGVIDLRLPFAIGGLALPLGSALRAWHAAFLSLNVVYILDEIENLSLGQQEVVNTLVRYAEGRAAFRITGRLYARKTLATIGGGEENRDGSEFKVTRLDDVLRNTKNYAAFATSFIAKRLGASPSRGGGRSSAGSFEPKGLFEELDLEAAVQRHASPAAESKFARSFQEALTRSRYQSLRSDTEVRFLVNTLVNGFPPLLQRLNVLLFCKKFGVKTVAANLAKQISENCREYVALGQGAKSSYATAVGHWKWDLFAQLCRESKRRDAVVPYAGFETFVAMSSHNPRNLLLLLGKVYEIASFKEIDLAHGARLSVEIQTSAAVDAARFSFGGDSNYGRQSDLAREAVSRLAELLRTARYALNVPEVAPLAISFDNDDLSPDGRQTLESAFNYSLLFEITEGRPDRNTQRIRRKIQLSPMLSPRWGLPIGRRGDISLSGPMLNAIFDPSFRAAFETLLRQTSTKWNYPFSSPAKDFGQTKLF